MLRNAYNRKQTIQNFSSKHYKKNIIWKFQFKINLMSKYVYQIIMKYDY